MREEFREELKEKLGKNCHLFDDEYEIKTGKNKTQIIIKKDMITNFSAFIDELDGRKFKSVDIISSDRLIISFNHKW